MSAVIYLMTLCLILGTILAIFVMRYVSAARQAQARLANDGAYREIAEKTAAAQSETATTLASIETALLDVRGRLTAIEKILKDVE